MIETLLKVLQYLDFLDGLNNYIERGTQQHAAIIVITMAKNNLITMEIQASVDYWTQVARENDIPVKIADAIYNNMAFFLT